MRALLLVVAVGSALLGCWLLVGDESAPRVAGSRAAQVEVTVAALTTPPALAAPVAASVAVPTTTTTAGAEAPAGSDGPGRAAEGAEAGQVLPAALRLSGVIVDGRARPVAGAVVEAAQQQNAPTMAGVLTDAQGRYELVLDPDRAPSVVRAHARGHALTLAEVPYDALVAGFDRVTREQPWLRLELPPLVLRDAVSVELRVRSSDGPPIPAQVALANHDLYAWPLRHTIGRDGVLGLELPPARYTVRASARGHVSLEATLEVVDGAVAELVLVRGVPLRGRVVDERGAPAPRGTTVRLLDSRRGGADPPLRRCGPEGEFEFESVAPGDYDLLVAGLELGAVEAVTVSGARGAVVEVRASPRARVRGRVTCQGRSGAWGQLRLRHARLGDLAGHDVSVLPDGTYAVDALLAGEWTASFSEPPSTTRWQATFVVAPGEDATRDLLFEDLTPPR